MKTHALQRIVPAALLVAGLTLGGLATGVGGGTAAAASLTATLSTGSTTTTVGASLSLAGSGFLPGEYVDISFVTTSASYASLGFPVARVQAGATAAWGENTSTVY